MPLKSLLFAGNAKLEACAVKHPAHVVPEAKGEHVARIQAALMEIDDADIAANELEEKRYGKTTTAAVLKYKQDRKIINKTYQDKADEIVGIMTIDRLDKDMLERQEATIPRKRLF